MEKSNFDDGSKSADTTVTNSQVHNQISFWLQFMNLNFEIICIYPI